MKQYKTINVLKFLCAIFIIVIHTVNSEVDTGYFFITTARIATPLFFMITGYFLSDKIYNKDFQGIHRYAMKIFKLYCIWSIVYIIGAHQNYFCYPTLRESIKNILKLFVFYGTYAHLWYLISCFVAVYIVYFLINSIGTKGSIIVSSLLYTGCLFFDSYYFLSPDILLEKVINPYREDFGEIWNSFLWILIFLVIGIAVKKYYDGKKVSIKGILAVYILYIIENFVLVRLKICFDNNTSVLLPLVTTLIFLYVLHLEEKIGDRIPDKLSNTLKGMSMVIYLVHPLIQLYIMKYMELKRSTLLFFIVLGLSLMFALVVTLIKNRGTGRKQ